MKYALCLISLFVLACNPSEKEQPKKIRVTGEGKIRVKPNQVVLTLQVSFTKPRMAEAVNVTQATVDSVVNILRTFQQNEQDIKTSSISANKEYNYNGRKQVLVGYRAEQSINFVLNNIQKLTPLTAQLLQTKISSISQIQFGHSQADSLFREADLLAYDDALKSAQKLCNRANVALGKLIFMSNAQPGTHYEGNAYVVSQEMNTQAVGYGVSGFRISPEVLEFKRSIISEYKIAP